MARKLKEDETEFDTATTVEDAPVEDAENIEDAPVEDADEDEENIEAFSNAVQAALAEADSATGVLPEASLAAVRAEFQSLDGVKRKNMAKRELQALMLSYTNEMDIVHARAVASLIEHAAVAARPAAIAKERVKADPTKAYAESLTILKLASMLASTTTPEGVDLERAEALSVEDATNLYPEAWEVLQSEDRATDNKIVAKAIKFATSKVPGASPRAGHSGPRRNVGTHVEEAAAAHEAGTFLTVAELRNFRSEEYGDDLPSAGALTNRLEPPNGSASTIKGVRVERRSVGGREKLGVVVL